MLAKNLPDRTPAIDKLHSWETYRLILLVAPQNAGKTILLRQWVQRLNQSGLGEPRPPAPVQVAWLDLSPKEDDPENFMAALAGALHTAGLDVTELIRMNKPAAMLGAGSGEHSAVSRTAHGDIQFDLGMTVLTNALARFQGELILVLDHYDNIQSATIHEAIARLLDYLPPKVHLVIACREEPPLPIPRLRARRQMVEIKESEFTS